MANKATAAQMRIFDFVKNGVGNGIIDAVAGAGKTTTLMGCVNYIPNLDDVVYCAFNTSIRKELTKKFHSIKKNVKVSTIHALGFQLLRATKNYTIDDRKYRKIIEKKEFLDSLLPEIDGILYFHGFLPINQLRELDERRKTLDWQEKNDLNEGQKYAKRIMDRLLMINDKYRCTLESDTPESYDSMVKHFGIFDRLEIQASTYKEEIKLYFKAHQKMLKEGNSMAISHGIIDYTDMLYMPVVLNLTSHTQYGFVFVDECQDLSRAQVAIVSKFLKPDGRLLAVGDPYQSIYGFAGADSESFERIKNTFICTPLPLTDCFRCPQSVIQLAKSIRSDINGYKQEAGVLQRIHQRDVIGLVQPGNLIICRTRKPLLSMALTLINKDFKVKLHPDEVDEFIGDYKNYFTPKELRTILDEEMIDDFFENARQRNTVKIEEDNKNADPIIRKILIDETVSLMEQTLSFLKRKYFDWHLNSLSIILKRLKQTLLWPGDDAVKLSTVHRAKGLENDVVFILEYNKMPPSRELDWEKIQERNLLYVALTRPKQSLYLCEEELATDGDSEGYQEEIERQEHEHKDVQIEVVQAVPKENAPAEEQDAETPIAVKPNILRNYIKIRPIQRMSNVPKKFYALADVIETPFAALNGRISQKAKYWAVNNNLQDTEYAIHTIISSNYLDAYYISTPEGIEIYDGHYDGGGTYNFRPRGICKNREQVLHYLNDESGYAIDYEYKPQNFGFEAVHNIVEATCKENRVSITNIIQESYSIIYCLKTLDTRAYIKLMYNQKGTITTLMPYSSVGEEDTTLKLILDDLSHLWQQ